MSRKRHHLVIRADASYKIGAGHVMRCLALGQAWQDLGGSVVFACRELPDSLRKRIQNEHMQFEPIKSPIGSQEDALETLAIANDNSANALVFDGYGFDQAYHDTVVGFNGSTLMIDDYGQINRYKASFLLNPNLGADQSLYENRDENTRLLLGPKYALLRREFLSGKSNPTQRSDEIRNVLVTVGGSDPTNSLQTIIKAIVKSNRQTLKFRVIAGPLHKHVDTLAAIAKLSTNVELIQSADDMAAEYEWADLAIAAAGSTNWEMCCFNLPRILVQTAENQSVILHQLTQRGVAVSMGVASELTEQIVQQKLNFLCDNPTNVQNSISACQKLNQQVARKNVASMLWPHLSLRPANAQDMQIYFDWANESSVRNASLTSDQIDWKTHESWFLTRLKDENSRLYVAQMATKRIGQIRLEKGTDGYWLIGLSVDQGYRGMGLASIMISNALDKMYSEGWSKFRARIKESNSASWKIFEKLNFNLIAKDADNVRDYELITTSTSKFPDSDIYFAGKQL